MKLTKLSLILVAGGIVAITLGTVVHTEPQPQPPVATPQAARYTITAGPITYVDGTQLTFQTFVRLDTTTGQAWAMFYVAGNGTNYMLPDWIPVVERFPNAGPTASKAAPSPATR